MKERLKQKMNSLWSSVSKSEAESPTKWNQQNFIRTNTQISIQQQCQLANSERRSTIMWEQEAILNQNGPDFRYNKIEEYAPLSELGFIKNDIQNGQIAVFVEKNMVSCKLSTQQYQQIDFFVTNYKIGLRPKEQDFTFFPLGKIEKLHKYVDGEKIWKLLIQLKDGRRFKFKITTQSLCKRVYDTIYMFAFIKNKQRFFAFRHFEYNHVLQEKFKGWQIYNPIKQFERMGIKLMDHNQGDVQSFTSNYKILDNSNGKVCQTYPSIMIVPSRMPYDQLVKCAKFRSKQRMPSMTFAYQYAQNKFACVYRSSQSKVGMKNSRSTEDQMMLRLIGNPQLDPKNIQQNQPNKKDCKIYDARGYYAALGNKIAGKGFQSEEFYQNCKVDFMNIPNIHAVRQSYNKTIEAAMGEDNRFYIVLAESKWYEYVFLILYGAMDLARQLSRGINSLVHCSDGWDRTAQLCSLVSIILDPYYRTIQGFMVSIQKDWIYFGHQFAKRMGQGINDPTNQDRSQVFLQFLDCVTQIMHQFPSEFQFNFKFIQQIGQQAYSNLYGNFICNCQKDMIKNQIFTSTISLWSRLKSQEQLYKNPFYVPLEKTLMKFQANQKNMRFWKQHFLQHIDTFKDIYGIYSCKFTENNLQIMHQHILQQKILLSEKYSDNESMLSNIENQMIDYSNSEQYKMVFHDEDKMEKE